MSTSSLTEKSELLLGRFLDGECSSEERAEAARLLEASSEARDYFSHLKKTRSFVCTAFDGEHVAKVDLWSRISARIDSEEHAALFLGERRIDEVPRGLRTKLFGWLGLGENRYLWGGFAGSAVAACAAITLVNLSSSNPADPAASASLNSEGILPVESFEAASSGAPNLRLSSFSEDELPKTHGRPRIIDPVGPRFDLVRSSGRPRVIRNASGGSPVIWVARAPRSMMQGPGLSAARVQPAARTPLVLDRGVPDAVPVLDFKNAR